MPQRVLHCWSNDTKVYLELLQLRWRCRECGCSFDDRADLLRPYSRITRQAEQEALWQLKERSFKPGEKRYRIRYSTPRRLLEREADGDALDFVTEEGIRNLKGWPRDHVEAFSEENTWR